MVKDAADLFRVSEKTIYRWIANDGLPAFRINKQYRFNRVELLEWASLRKINVSPQAALARQEPGDGLASLADALHAGGVHYRVDGSDKEQVLRSVVGLMRLPDQVDRDHLLQILLERESLSSTAIGDGIAIPHVRNPIVLHVAHPAATLCFLEKPIDFGALDGKPVHVLVALVSPSIRGHLHILSRLSFALRDAGFRQALVEQASREAILQEARRIEDGIALSAGADTETPRRPPPNKFGGATQPSLNKFGGAIQVSSDKSGGATQPLDGKSGSL